MFCRLKDFRRIATRYDRLAINFLAAVCIAAAVSYWSQEVQTLKPRILFAMAASGSVVNRGFLRLCPNQRLISSPDICPGLELLKISIGCSILEVRGTSAS